MITPQVSVLMLVYQQQEFVAQAIESILSQRTDFAFELIIIDDCSDDGSAVICRSYAKQEPSIITFIDNPTNIGMHKSFAKIWHTSTADLVAFCEGDDYWVDVSKLQKQVDLMRENLHWNLCGAKANVVELSSEGAWATTSYLHPVIEKDEYSFEDMIGAYHFHFSTVMLRKSSVVFPQWFMSVYCVDRPIYLLATHNSMAGYLNNVVSSYRVHSGGNWSSISSVRKSEQSADLFEKLSSHFETEYRPKFEITLFNILQTYAAREMVARRYSSARLIFRKAFSKLNFINKLRCFRKYYRTAILLLVRR